MQILNKKLIKLILVYIFMASGDNCIIHLFQKIYLTFLIVSRSVVIEIENGEKWT
jgi:hypothetical protein